MSECLPDFPRYVRQFGDNEWKGADHPDGPWRPIPAPQSGLPWGQGMSDEELLESAAKALGYKSIPSDETCLTAEAGELLDFARNILARSATLLAQQGTRITDLRAALAECGRAVGSLIQDSCSDSFLLQVPDEIRLAVAKAAPPAPEAGEVGDE